jgi:hypothetical protein
MAVDRLRPSGKQHWVPRLPVKDHGGIVFPTGF